jgi:hypothetical protein
MVAMTGIDSGGCERRFQSLDNTFTRGTFRLFAWRGICKSIAAILEHASAGSRLCSCQGVCWEIYGIKPAGASMPCLKLTRKLWLHGLCNSTLQTVSPVCTFLEYISYVN